MAVHELAVYNLTSQELESLDTGDIARFLGSLQLDSGTANGVAYLNGSKVLTAGSGLQYSNGHITQVSANDTTGLYHQLRTLDFTGSCLIGVEGSVGGVLMTGATAYATVIGSTSSGTVTQIASAGAVRVTLDSAGNLGLGGTPTTKLDVRGSVSSLVANFQDTTTPYIRVTDGSNSLGMGLTASEVFVGSLSNSPVALRVNNTEKVRWDANGNQGNGVTPSAWDGSYKAIQLGGSGVSLWTAAASGGNAYVSNNVYFDGTNRKYIANAAAAEYESGSVGHVWKVAASGTAGANISFTQAMKLDTSGNLLLGATSASELLTLQKGGSDSCGISLSQSGASGRRFVLSSTGLGYTSAGLFVIYDATAGAERYQIDASGNHIQSLTGSAPTLTVNGTLTAHAASDTSLVFSYRGSDGTTRSVALTLA